MSVKSDGSDDGSEPEDVFGRFHGLFDEPDRETTFVYDLPSADGPPLHLELVGIRSDLRQVVTTTGQTVWESAVVLARYLHDTGRPLIAGKRVLELGSGLGLCGFAAASHAACMVLTDGDDIAMELLRKNAQRNGMPERPGVVLRRLMWGQDLDEFRGSVGGSFDVIIGADVAYDPDALEPLWCTVDALLAHGVDALFVLGFYPRYASITQVRDVARRFGFEAAEGDDCRILHFRRCTA